MSSSNAPGLASNVHGVNSNGGSIVPPTKSTLGSIDTNSGNMKTERIGDPSSYTAKAQQGPLWGTGKPSDITRLHGEIAKLNSQTNGKPNPEMQPTSQSSSLSITPIEQHPVAPPILSQSRITVSPGRNKYLNSSASVSGAAKSRVLNSELNFSASKTGIAKSTAPSPGKSADLNSGASVWELGSRTCMII